MIGIDLFSGAGGMSVGATMAGVRVVLAIEAEPNSALTYKRNHPNVDVIQKDIRLIHSAGLNVFNPIRKLRKREPIIVFGGPPCQGFSTSNQRTRSADNPTNWLFREYLRIVSTIRPDWVVFENVRGILETDNGRFFQQVLNELSLLRYATSHWVLNAKDFQVAQDRARLFIVGSRSGCYVPMPQSMSGKPITVKEAIADLPVLENGASESVLPYSRSAHSEYAKAMRGQLNQCANHIVSRNAKYILQRYRHIRQGGNWESIPQRLMTNYADRYRCHTGIYYRLRSNEPSIVIGNFRKNMLVHPWQNRGLSVREAARLQSFPDWYEFTGSIGFQQQQVGNAVPPRLAKAVFKAIFASDQE